MEYQRPTSDHIDIEERRAELNKYIERNLPGFLRTIEEAVSSDDKEKRVLLFHQDAFAADYQADEYSLLGKAIKYVGEIGLTITVIGTNRDTLK